MKKQLILIFIFIAFFISSCGREKTEMPAPELEETVIASEETEPEEFQPEQIFTYQEKLPERTSSREPEEIYLRYSRSPIEIKGEGYTRFIGYVDGLLLVEVGGEGRLLNIGDAIGDYVISRIRFNEVKLEKKGI